LTLEREERFKKKVLNILYPEIGKLLLHWMSKIFKTPQMTLTSTQETLSLKVFKDYSNIEFGKIVSMFPKPRSLAFPPYLSKYVFSMISQQNISGLIDKCVMLDGIAKSDNSWSLFLVITESFDILSKVVKILSLVPNYQISLLVIPRLSDIGESFLTESGFNVVRSEVPANKKDISIFDFHADFLPIEDDFFVMPSLRSIFEIQLKGNMADIYNSARSLSKIQALYGKIPKIYCAGQNAQSVCEVLKNLMAQTAPITQTSSQIDSMIIIDRMVDMVTPILTQTTVEGVIDDAFGIEYAICSLPPGVLPKKETITLVDKNEAYRALRMLSIGKAVDHIKSIIRETNESLEQLKSDSSFKEKNEVSIKLKKLSDLKGQLEECSSVILTAIESIISTRPYNKAIMNNEFSLLQKGESVLEFTENLINIYNDWESSLRMLSLESLVGITHSKKVLSFVQKEYCSEFGIKEQSVLIYLDKLRFLSPVPYPWKWNVICREMNLFPEDDDPLKEPLDGFVPLSIRIIQNAVKNEWKNIQKTFDETMYPFTIQGEAQKKVDDKPLKVLVFFVGGITLSEAGILRKMGTSLSSGRCEFIVGATEIINNHTLFSTFINHNK